MGYDAFDDPAPVPSRSSSRAGSAWARPRWSARSPRSCRCAPRRSSAPPSAGIDMITGVEAQAHHDRGHGLRADHDQRQPGRLPVRHARPGALLVHVGRPVARRPGRRGPGRRPAPGRLLPVHRLLRAPQARRSSWRSTASPGHARTRTTRSGGPSTSTRTCRSSGATRGSGDRAGTRWSPWSTTRSLPRSPACACRARPARGSEQVVVRSPTASGAGERLAPPAPSGDPRAAGPASALLLSLSSWTGLVTARRQAAGQR